MFSSLEKTIAWTQNGERVKSENRNFFKNSLRFETAEQIYIIYELDIYRICLNLSS